ncbi:hypothetical protein TNCV_2524101 [Trichonephila clavipes]|nr:hypothetical protein TNCV_2524101 [Trichonephila clavipes]
MEEITNIDDIASEEGSFLPHHGVLRAGNHSRALRVVFNGSQKTDLDISLNDVLSNRVTDSFSPLIRKLPLNPGLSTSNTFRYGMEERSVPQRCQATGSVVR